MTARIATVVWINRQCSIEGCDGPVSVRGWCEKHYARWKRYRRDPRLRRAPRLTLAERAWRYIQRDPITGCWNWTGQHDPNGYAYVGLGDGKKGTAHRALYELLVEPVPAGLDLDHLCRNRGCVNPAHLDPVTHQENIRRGWAARGKSTVPRDWHGRWTTDELQGVSA